MNAECTLWGARVSALSIALGLDPRARLPLDDLGATRARGRREAAGRGGLEWASLWKERCREGIQIPSGVIYYPSEGGLVRCESSREYVTTVTRCRC